MKIDSNNIFDVFTQYVKSAHAWDKHRAFFNTMKV